MKETAFGFSKKVKMTLADAETKVRGILKDNGFGVLTEIDVKRTLKEKIGADFRPYKILGACNPKFAHKALTSETEIGLMMPCNVIVYEDDDGGTVVAAINPSASIGAVKNPELVKVAAEVSEKLKGVIAAL